MSIANIPRVILLTGEEDYLLRNKLNEIKSAATYYFDINLLDGANPVDVVLASTTNPFGNMRIVIYNTDISQVSSECLEEYIKSPCDTTVLVIVSPSCDKRKTIYKLIEKHGKIYCFDKLKQNDFLSFIDSFLKEKSAGYDYSIVQYIAEKSGYLVSDNARLGELVSDLNRLYDVAGSEVITKAVVDRIITSHVDTDVFRLINLIATGKFDKATEVVKGLLDTGVNEFFLLTMLLRHYRILYKLKLVKDKNILELSPFVLREFCDLNSLSIEQIESAILLVSSKSQEIKKGNCKSYFALELLIPELCQVSRR